MATTGSAMEGLGKKLAIGLAAAFSVQKITAFGAASVREAAAAGAVWNRLGGTLQTVGVEFDAVRGNIERAAQAMERATTVGDEQFAETLQTLVRITGDYNASLAEVTTVANLAAGAQIDLNTAAQLVGKVMVGETGTLKRYGIVVEEGADAMQLLRDRFRGMASNEANTLQGKVAQLSNAWGNFKEAIGDALTEANNGPSVLTQLTEVVRDGTAWVEDNADAFKVWGDVLVDTVKWLGKTFDLLVKINGITPRSILDNLSAITPNSIAADRRDASTPRSLLERLSAVPARGAPRRSGGSGRPLMPTGIGTPELSEEALAAAAAAAKAAADRLAIELDRAAGKTKDMKVAFVAAAEAAAEAAEDFRNAKLAQFSQAIKELKVAAQDATADLLASKRSKTLQNDIARKLESIPVAGESLGAKLGGLVSQFTGLSASMGPLALAAIALKPVFDGLRESLGPAIDQLAEPLREIGRILGTILAPVLLVLAEPLRAISQSIGSLLEPLRLFALITTQLIFPFQRLAPVIELVGKAFSYVNSAIGHLLRGIGNLLNKLPGSLGNGLKDLGQSLIDNAEAYRKGERVFGQMTDAAEKFTDTLTTGLPQGFRVLNLELAKFTSSRAVPFSGSAPIGSGGATVNDHRVITINAFQQPGEDQDTFVRKIREVIVRREREMGLTYAGNPYALLPGR